jgi:hypothetical protein
VRCYLIKKGRIVASEEFLDLSKEEAIEKARTLLNDDASASYGEGVTGFNRGRRQK